MQKITKTQRQKKILKLFQKQHTLALKNILEQFLDVDITQITLIRDLEELQQKGYLKKEGKGRGAVYIQNTVGNLLDVIDHNAYFQIPSYERNTQTKFNFNIFEVLKKNVFLPDEIKYLELLHSKFQEKFKRFTSPVSVQKEYERIVIEFAWKSSSIEGNTYTLLETERLIKENKETEGKTKLESQMILNHKLAFDFILENTKDFTTLSRYKLESIHSLLTQNLGIQKNLRTTPVGITGSEYKPLDNQFQIEEAVEKMFILLSGKTNFFEQSLLILLLLSYIQAFEDGNKRTARTFANSVLLAHKSCPISFKTVDEVEYKKATLLFYEQNNISYMKEIFIQQYEYSVNNYF